jgi:hypothetical protein
MAAARLLAERRRKLGSVHEGLTMGRRVHAAFPGPGDGNRSHHKAGRSVGVEGDDGTSPRKAPCAALGRIVAVVAIQHG